MLANVIKTARQQLAQAKYREDCIDLWQHKNTTVRMMAWGRMILLPEKGASVPVPTVAAMSTSEFDLLVERFSAEGKKDPVRSARASLAARARSRKAG